MPILNSKPYGYMTLVEFSECSVRTYRTLQNWLANGKITAVYDEFSKRWLINEAKSERVQTQGVVGGRHKRQA